MLGTRLCDAINMSLAKEGLDRILVHKASHFQARARILRNMLLHSSPGKLLMRSVQQLLILWDLLITAAM
jgi:hypothetical protein